MSACVRVCGERAQHATVANIGGCKDGVVVVVVAAAAATLATTKRRCQLLSGVRTGVFL